MVCNNSQSFQRFAKVKIYAKIWPFGCEKRKKSDQNRPKTQKNRNFANNYRQNRLFMQERHQNRKQYFNELANTSRTFYIDYLRPEIEISEQTRVLEIGCGEGGNLLPFAEIGCQVTGIDLSETRIAQAARISFSPRNLRPTTSVSTSSSSTMSSNTSKNPTNASFSSISGRF